MLALKDRTQQIADALAEHSSLLVHAQDLLVSNVWATLPPDACSYLEHLSYVDLARLPTSLPATKTPPPESLMRLLALREIALPRYPQERAIDGTHRAVSVALQTKGERRQKKAYEVERLTTLVASMASSSSARVLDVGCGKGHLAAALAEKGMDVIGLEAQADMTVAATATPCNTASQRGRVRMWHRAIMADERAASILDEVYDEAWTEARPYDPAPTAVVCALHACGDLSATVLRGFAGSARLRMLALVPCCYHLLTVADETEVRTLRCEACESAADDRSSSAEASARVPSVAKETAAVAGFPLSAAGRAIGLHLSREMRMLSTRREAAGVPPTWLEPLESERSDGPPPSLVRMLHDCLFALLIRTHYSDLVEVGARVATGGLRKHRAPCRALPSKLHDFASFAQAVLAQVGLPDRLGHEALARFAEATITTLAGGSLEVAIRRLAAITSLRALLAQLAESAVLCDQMLFLREQGIDDVELIPLFEPSRSPRNMAIVARKRSRGPARSCDTSLIDGRN